MKIKKPVIYFATFATAAGLSVSGANPVIKAADKEEVLYEVDENNFKGVIEEDYKPTPTPTPENNEKREYKDDEFIDADNWSKDKDIDPKAGDKIPEDVKTEKEKKKLTPTPKPSTPPKEIPKTGETKTSPITNVVLGGLGGAVLYALLEIKRRYKAFANIEFETEENTKTR